jgi:hypothetical protein
MHTVYYHLLISCALATLLTNNYSNGVVYTHSGAVAAVAGGELSLYNKHTNVQRFTTAEEDTDPSAVQFKFQISHRTELLLYTANMLSQ